MSKNFSEGKWINLTSTKEAEERAKKANSGSQADVWKIKNNWTGPGKYMELVYQQRCPRGCCYDCAYEIVSADEVAAEVAREIRDLAEILKAARTKVPVAL